MILIAALVPPREVLDDLWGAVEAVGAQPVADEESGHRAKKPGFLSRRRAQRDDAPAGPPPLELEPPDHVHLPITKFGNLALIDANRLVDALVEQAAEWSTPRLRLSGYTTLESEEDPSVWVELSGDLEELSTVTRGVNRVAQGLRLFVDRRIFQPRVRLGRLTQDATDTYAEALLSAIDRFDGNAWWQTEVLLLTPAEPGPDHGTFKTYATIPLGPHVVH